MNCTVSKIFNELEIYVREIGRRNEKKKKKNKV